MPNDTTRVEQESPLADNVAGFYYVTGNDTPLVDDVYWSRSPFPTTPTSQRPPELYYSPYGTDNGEREHALLSFILPFQALTTIVSAYLTVKVYSSDLALGEAMTVTIKGLLSTNWDYAVDGPILTADAVSMWSSDMTVASVTRNLPLNELTEGSEVAIADVTDILQELIDQPGWVEDGRILLIIHVDNAPGVRTIQTRSVSGSSSYAYIDVESYYNPTPADYDVHLTHELEIEQDVDGYNSKEVVEHELEIEQDIIGLHYHVRSYEDELTIDSTLRYYVNEIEEQEIEDIITIIQTLSAARVQTAEYEDEVSFTQELTATAPTYSGVPYDTLTIEQDIDYTRVYSKEVEDEIEIESEVTTHTHYASVEHSLDNIQSVVTEYVFGGVYDVEHTLDVDQDVSRAVTFNREYEDDLSSDLDHFGLGYFDFDHWD